MSANESLQQVQSELQAAGVHDVKFCFQRGLKSVPSSEVAQYVATFLQTYLKQQHTEYVPAIECATA